MEPPRLKPSNRVQFSERRHCDPPALWYTVILGSFFIHLCGFGILHLLLISGFVGMKSAKELISIDVIAIVPSTTSTTQLAPKTLATPTQKPTTINNSTQNRKPASSTTSTTRTVSPQRETNQPPAVNTKKLTPSNSPQKPSGGLPPKTKPNSPSRKNTPSSTASSPATSPSPTSSSPSPTPTKSESGGGFIARLGELSLSNKNDINDIGKQCSIPENNQQNFAHDYVKQLGVNLDQVLVLKAILVIETNGTANVEPQFTQVLQGNISVDKAAQLASQVIKSWQFERNCTYMGGKPVPYPYYVQLTIRPAPK